MLNLILTRFKVQEKMGILFTSILFTKLRKREKQFYMKDTLNIVNSRSYKHNVVTVKVKDLQVIRVLFTKKRFFENMNIFLF